MPSSARGPLAQLSADLSLFGTQIAGELSELKRNADVRPITGATLYKHCLGDLNERLAGLSEDVEALEGVSLDAISLEELVGHCAALYIANAATIAALEARLASFGYAETFSPAPPANPLAPPHTDAENTLIDSEAPSPLPASPDLLQSPDLTGPSGTLARFGTAAKGLRGAAAALAPMTAAKARVQAHADDTPSSLDSPDALTPSMRHLLGKYAASSSSLGLSLSGLSEGASPAPTRATTTAGASPSPLMLSPAFAAAAEAQRAAMEEAAPVLAASPVEEAALPLLPSSPLPPPADADAELLAADALVAATVEKIVASPELLESYRERYPVVAASAERVLASADRQGSFSFAPSPMLPAVPGGYAFDEETTMELKSQVIFSRAAAAAAPAAVVPQAAPEPAISARESLEEAIAAALARPNAASSGGAASAAPAAHVTPAAPPASAASQGARTAPRTATLTPSLPSTVAPLRVVEESEYATLPNFLRNGLPLDTLNEWAAEVHAVAERRCAAGGGPSFTRDDVEAAVAAAEPAKAAKALMNSLVKLDRVQIKVLYGKGTVYFFI